MKGRLRRVVVSSTRTLSLLQSRYTSTYRLAVVVLARLYHLPHFSKKLFEENKTYPFWLHKHLEIFDVVPKTTFKGSQEKIFLDHVISKRSI